MFDVLNGPIGFLNELSDVGANFRLSILWFFVLVSAGSFLMKSTRYGNWVAAVGGNRQAALSQGVPVNRVLVTNFVMTGLLAGLAGVIQTSWRLSVDPLRGSGLELVVVAACVIGGVKLTGGYGTVWGCRHRDPAHPCARTGPHPAGGGDHRVPSRHRSVPDRRRGVEHLPGAGGLVSGGPIPLASMYIHTDKVRATSN